MSLNINPLLEYELNFALNTFEFESLFHVTTCTCTGTILWAVSWENLQDPEGVGREKKQNGHVWPTTKQRSVKLAKYVYSN